MKHCLKSARLSVIFFVDLQRFIVAVVTDELWLCPPAQFHIYVIRATTTEKHKVQLFASEKSKHKNREFTFHDLQLDVTKTV